MNYSDTSGNRISVQSLGLAPAVSISGKSAVATGTILDGLTVRQNAVLTVTGSAGVSAGTVVLQASNDGTNFYNVTGASVSPSASTTTTVVAQNVFARYFRAAITTAISGGTVVSASVGVSG